MKNAAIPLLAMGLLSGLYNGVIVSGIAVDFGPATVLILASIAVRMIWPD